MSNPDPAFPVYRGMNYCDLCGRELARSDRVSGVCPECRAKRWPRRKPPVSRVPKPGPPEPGA
jgi:hypothetical protein